MVYADAIAGAIRDRAGEVGLMGVVMIIVCVLGALVEVWLVYMLYVVIVREGRLSKPQAHDPFLRGWKRSHPPRWVARRGGPPPPPPENRTGR
jgi:hypothetical protein